MDNNNIRLGKPANLNQQMSLTNLSNNSQSIQKSIIILKYQKTEQRLNF